MKPKAKKRIGIIVIIAILYFLFTSKKSTVSKRNANTTSTPKSTGGASTTYSGGNTTNPPPSDNFTYTYQYGSNFVKYTPTPNTFEKTTGYNRDASRRMMPIDLFSWCIANRNRDKLIFCNYKLKDANGNVLFEVYDTEGAVHVSLAQNDRETTRGNNHQEQYGRFLIKEGTYTIEFTRLNGSNGIPSLWVVEQHDGNRFKCLVGNSVGQTLGSVDNIGVNITTTYSTSFNVDFIDESNCFIKANANGFDS